MKAETYRAIRTGYFALVLILAANALPIPDWARNILQSNILGGWPLVTIVSVAVIVGSSLIYKRKFG